jgi:hypothetical protein
MLDRKRFRRHQTRPERRYDIGQPMESCVRRQSSATSWGRTPMVRQSSHEHEGGLAPSDSRLYTLKILFLALANFAFELIGVSFRLLE